MFHKIDYFNIFNSILFTNYVDHSSDNIEINDKEKEQQNLDIKDINNKIIIDQIEPFIKVTDDIKQNNNAKINNKKRKIKKMKNYNIRKGDWQCKHCFNINFHFRKICNICNSTP